MAYQEGDFPYNILGNCKDSLGKVVLGKPWHCFTDLRSLEDGRQKENESSFVKFKNPLSLLDFLYSLQWGQNLIL